MWYGLWKEKKMGELKKLEKWFKEELRYMRLSKSEKNLLKFQGCDIILSKMSNELLGIKESLNKESKNHKYYALRHYLNFFEYIMCLELVMKSKGMCYWKDAKLRQEGYSIAYRYTMAGNYFIHILNKTAQLHRHFEQVILVVLCTDKTLELSEDLLICLDEIEGLIIRYFKKQLMDWHTRDEVDSNTWKILN